MPWQTLPGQKGTMNQEHCEPLCHSIITCCRPPWKSRWTPIKILIQMSRLMVSCKHQESMKMFVTGRIKLSVGNRVGLKMAWERRERRLVWSYYGVSSTGAGWLFPHIVWIFHWCQRWEPQALLSAWTDVGQKGKRENQV